MKVTSNVTFFPIGPRLVHSLMIGIDTSLARPAVTRISQRDVQLDEQSPANKMCKPELGKCKRRRGREATESEEARKILFVISTSPQDDATPRIRMRGRKTFRTLGPWPGRVRLI